MFHGSGKIVAEIVYWGWMSFSLVKYNFLNKYIVLGTGAEIVIGIVESNYRGDMPLEEAEQIVISSLKSVAKRDVLSGMDIDLIIVDKAGLREKAVSLK